MDLNILIIDHSEILILYSIVRIVSPKRNSIFSILTEEISLFILLMNIVSNLQLQSNFQLDNLVKAREGVEDMLYQTILIIFSKEKIYQSHHFSNNQIAWITTMTVRNHKTLEEETNLFQVLSAQDLGEQTAL